MLGKRTSEIEEILRLLATGVAELNLGCTNLLF
jgi:hypothetical protein